MKLLIKLQNILVMKLVLKLLNVLIKINSNCLNLNFIEN